MQFGFVHVLIHPSVSSASIGCAAPRARGAGWLLAGGFAGRPASRRGAARVDVVNDLSRTEVAAAEAVASVALGATQKIVARQRLRPGAMRDATDTTNGSVRRDAARRTCDDAWRCSTEGAGCDGARSRRSEPPTSRQSRAKRTLQRELQEALDYRQATSDILRVISRSAFDLTSVLLTVVTSAKTLCRAEMAVLFRYQDGAYRFAVGHGLSPDYEAAGTAAGDPARAGHRGRPRGTGPADGADRGCLDRPGLRAKADARVGEVRSMLGVPLLREGVPIGVIGLGAPTVEPFTERQIELVSTFADQAVIAIENVRLFEELQAAREAAERERDVAEAARAEAEAANRAKSTFLAAMSHEIRTPMNGVLGMMEVLERSRLEPAQARSVAVMRDSAQALLRIIDDVLDFSKIDAGRMDVEALPFSLGELVAGTVETMLPQARQKHLALFADPPGGGPDRVTGDPMRVRQILFNLVGNAIKFTDRGFVRISTDSRAGGGGTVLVTHGGDRQRDRHGRRPRARGCSSHSPRRTARPHGVSAAPAWAFRSCAGWRS